MGWLILIGVILTSVALAHILKYVSDKLIKDDKTDIDYEQLWVQEETKW